MKAIVAVDNNWGIGRNNGLLFSIKKDMAFFREKTKNAVVCMGYNTLLSFPNSKPLKGRINIVLCPDDVEREDCICVHSLDELFKVLEAYDGDNTFVIGGAMFYKTMLDYVDIVYVTKVDADGQPTLFFENLDEKDNFELIDVSEPVDDNGLTLRFTSYRNINPKKYGA